MLVRQLVVAWVSLWLIGCTTSPPRPTTHPVTSVPVPDVVPPNTPEPPKLPVPPPVVVIPPPKIALVLGGGAAKGFAHIGVIKTLEAHGLQPQFVVGTSVGSVVGVLWAAGYDGFALQTIAMGIKESGFSDWSLPNRGFFKGESLREFVNQKVDRRPLEKLNRQVAVVATELQTGQIVAFMRGDAGTAVQASSSVPGVFQPVRINDHEYVDGGVVSPVPVMVAKRMGADIVVAVDISARPALRKVEDMLDVLLQTYAIMGNAIASYELTQADVVVRPDISKLNSTDFASRHLAILEGERAALAVIAGLREKIAERERRLKAAAQSAPPPQ